MHTVLGLSLNSDEVAWMLVDAAAGTVLDHDVLEFNADAEIAGAAARGAHAIARACGFEVDRVRLTWSGDAARDGAQLQTRLEKLGFSDVEAVPLACAMAVIVAPEAMDMAPRSALAYGAALAAVDPSDAITVPVVQQTPRRRPSGRRLVPAVLGGAAAAVVGVLCLSAGSAPDVEPAATTADQSAAPDSGWASVPAPSNAAADVVRKVVATPSYVPRPAAKPVQTYRPVQTYPQVRIYPPVQAVEPEQTNVPVQADVPVPADVPVQALDPLQALEPLPPIGPAPGPAETPAEPVAAPIPVPAELPHLSGAHLAVGPVADPESAPAPGPDMTDPQNVFTAVP